MVSTGLVGINDSGAIVGNYFHDQSDSSLIPDSILRSLERLGHFSGRSTTSVKSPEPTTIIPMDLSLLCSPEPSTCALVLLGAGAVQAWRATEGLAQRIDKQTKFRPPGPAGGGVASAKARA